MAKKPDGYWRAYNRRPRRRAYRRAQAKENYLKFKAMALDVTFKAYLKHALKAKVDPMAEYDRQARIRQRKAIAAKRSKWPWQRLPTV